MKSKNKKSGKNSKKEVPIVQVVNPGTHSVGGIECCCFRCCTCVHIEFFRSAQGMLKLLETIISGFIQSLLINYGLRYAANIGSAFEGALTTSSGCFITSAVLLACYLLSEKSYKAIRSSLFEFFFNTLSCFFYASSAAYLAFATKVFLWPLYVISPGFDVFPAMTAAYMLCGIASVIYGIDAFVSFKDYKFR